MATPDDTTAPPERRRSIAVSAATAQTPSTSPPYGLSCSDCSGTEYFGELDGADTADCQHYEANRFENWTAEGESSPDPKFIAAAQADIVEVNEFTDTNFVYYQVATRATSWSTVPTRNRKPTDHASHRTSVIAQIPPAHSAPGPNSSRLRTASRAPSDPMQEIEGPNPSSTANTTAC